MKEHPILFRGPMVRAIIDGRKTQTRRVIKPQPPRWRWARVKEYAERDGLTFKLPAQDYWVKPPPFGIVGNRLWVRETWFPCVQFGDAPIRERYSAEFVYRADDAFIGCHAWKPSIFMPRRASRLTLEITDIRIQRLQEIGELDAIAEGVDPCGHNGYHIDQYTCSFRSLWDDIHVLGWAANPWVWCLTFVRIA